MSNAFTDFQAAALANVVSILGEPFIYKGTTYQGVINEVELSNALEPGGFMETLGTIVIVQRCLMPTAPKAGETLTIAGKAVRIHSVKQDEVAYELHGVTAKK